MELQANDWKNVREETERLILEGFNEENFKEACEAFEKIRQAAIKSGTFPGVWLVGGEGSAEKFCKEMLKRTNADPMQDLALLIRDKETGEIKRVFR